MSLFFLVCAILSALLTVLSLGAGVSTMAKSAEFRERHANTLMRVRVISQGAAIFFVFLAYITYQS